VRKRERFMVLEFDFVGGKGESNPNPKGGENPNQEQTRKKMYLGDMRGINLVIY
jgi:hypothetical protein